MFTLLSDYGSLSMASLISVGVQYTVEATVLTKLWALFDLDTPTDPYLDIPM